MRCKMEINEYNYTIGYIPDKENIIAGILSKNYIKKISYYLRDYIPIDKKQFTPKPYKSLSLIRLLYSNLKHA